VDEVCPYCGETHDRAEDAACGCGCGDEPMGCGFCMLNGGPMPKFGPAREEPEDDEALDRALALQARDREHGDDIPILPGPGSVG